MSRLAHTQLSGLDFGCGDGRLITWSRHQGVGDFHGADTFYGDGEIGLENGGGDIPSATRRRISITEAEQCLPFPDDTFDFVCSNQVFEHVQDLAFTITELARITKPGGTHLHVFPTRERVVEGHLGVPEIHRLPTNRREAWARRWYPHVRFGDQTSSFDEWWNEMGPFLEKHTRYRSARAYDAAFAEHFRVRHVETEKLGYHLQNSRLHRVSGFTRVIPRRLELMRATYAVELRHCGTARSPEVVTRRETVAEGTGPVPRTSRGRSSAQAGREGRSRSTAGRLPSVSEVGAMRARAASMLSNGSWDRMRAEERAEKRAQVTQDAARDAKVAALLDAASDAHRPS